MKKSNVKSFPGLVKYARERAERSAKRNDPIAWAYWMDTRAWAAGHVRVGTGLPKNRENWPYLANAIAKEVELELRAELSISGRDFSRVAQLYSKAKWYRIMCLNQGKKDVGPLSLKWLHDLYPSHKK